MLVGQVAGRERETGRGKLERVMIVTTVVRTNEHLGTAFGIFQVSSKCVYKVEFDFASRIRTIVFER